MAEDGGGRVVVEPLVGEAFAHYRHREMKRKEKKKREDIGVVLQRK